MAIPPIPFRQKAVQPIACISSAWDLVKDRYWLFVGMCAIGLMIGGAIPIVLVGPMMCGLYLSFIKERRREPIEFGTLFKGFDFFGPSVIAALLHTLPIMAIVVPVYILFYLGFFVTIAVQGNDPNPGAFLGFILIMVVVWLAVMLAVMVISIAFMFAYPLIVDRG